MAKFKVVISPPVVATPSSPGQDDGEVDVNMRFMNLSHADEAAAILANLEHVSADTFSGALGMALALYNDAAKLRKL